MRIEHYPLEKLKKHVLDIVAKHLDVLEYKVFFFGSRVLGSGNERSDIDVGIEGPGEIPYEIMAKIKDEIDNLPILYKIEIVDFVKVSPDFYKVVSSRRDYL